MRKNICYESFHDKNDQITSFRCAHNDTGAHFHRCIEILYLIDGAIDCEINDVQYHADKDDIVFIRSCNIHEIKASPDYEYSVLIIEKRFSDDFANLFSTQTLPPLLNDKSFNQSLKQFFVFLENNPNISSIIKKGYINIIIGNLLDHYKSIPATHSPQIAMLINVLNYIDDHYKEQITLGDISASFGYDKYYFSRIFNLYIGDSLNHYINMVRIRNLISAARKSENPNLSHLIFEYGFTSLPTFYRNYSRLYDCSPTELFKQ